MSYWEDGYFEGSVFDEMIEELKTQIKSEVTQDVKNKIEYLEKQERRLSDVESENVKLRRENEEIKKKYEKSEKEIKEMTIDKLVDFIAKPVYMIQKYGNHIKFKKCSRCNSNREIHYSDPLGRETFCSCSCCKIFDGYSIYKRLGREFGKCNNKGIVIFLHNYWNEYSSETIYLDEKTKYIEDSEFDKENIAKKVTFDEEVAKTYCDYLNKGVREEAEAYAKKWGLEIEE